MANHEAYTLILLSCSHAKHSGGRLFDPLSRRIIEFLSDQHNTLVNRRIKLLKLLRGETGRLYNEDQKGGFRDLRSCNRQLVEGPDFNGSIPDRQIYLPAYERYCGRFFEQLTRESPDFWRDVRDKPIEIIFVSGLYGLVLWDELIQNYDCHLADRARNGKERPVWELWRDTLTSALIDLIRNRKTSKRFVVIYDLLSEEEYQRAFRWDQLQRLDVEIRHRVFRQSHGPDILTDLATLVAKRLPDLFPDNRAKFEPAQWHDIVDGGSQVRFERSALTELDHLKLSLKEAHPGLRRVPLETIEDFCLAEALWDKVRGRRDFPLASVVVSFATAVEGFLRSTNPTLKSETLGRIAYLSIQGDAPEVASVAAELKELNSLRKRAAHRASYEPGESRLNGDDVKKAQRLAYEVVERLAGRS